MIPFQHLGNPRLSFGAGRLSEVPGLLQGRDPVMLISGRHFAEGAASRRLEGDLGSAGHRLVKGLVSGEPSPEIVDALTEEARSEGVGTIVAVGGGSVLDAGKAVAAMLRHEGSVFDYLEGVGSRRPEGRTAPMIAAPTTAGTGSEATKNAVISRRGDGGFKKSLRQDAFIPQVAVVDPELAVGCPAEVSTACGMDAFCQLLESFVSTGATPLTDGIAWEGLRHFARGRRLFTESLYGTDDEGDLRGHLAFAAYCSGLTLANAGLATVHGLAGPLGAVCEVPHGVACGLLLAPVFRRMAAKAPMDRLQAVGALLVRGDDARPEDDDVLRVLDLFDAWARPLPRLSTYGLAEIDLDAVVAASGNKNSPVPLDDDERRAALVDVL